MTLLTSPSPTTSYNTWNGGSPTTALLWTSKLYSNDPIYGFFFPISTAMRRPARSLSHQRTSTSSNHFLSTSLISSSGWRHRFGGTQLHSVSNNDDNDDIAATQQEQIDAANDDRNNPFHNNSNIPQRRLIEVSSRIELPFSIYDAYDAYADLPRQSTWSNWLDSVVVQPNTHPEESVWTMKFLGMRYSWTAVAVQNQRPHVIQWRSVTGLSNFGTVRFYEVTPQCTRMTMSMTFVAPRAVSMAFQKSKTFLAKYVEQKMIAQSLQEFRNVVSKEVAMKQQQQQRNLTTTTTASSTASSTEE